jgi:hypothetical protein
VPWGQERVRDAFIILIVMLVDYQKTVADYRNVNDCEIRSQYGKVINGNEISEYLYSVLFFFKKRKVPECIVRQNSVGERGVSYTDAR